jgi:acetyl-CoA carboxylase biotin carboxyl carrier protein
VSPRDDVLNAIDAAGATLVPQLTERLTRHGLGEIEVRSGDVRVRVVARGAAAAPSTAATPLARATQPARPGSGRLTQQPAPSALGVTSPAVGYFAYIDALGPGLAVEKGDALGYVDVLGVRHDVRAPRSGTVRNLVTEAGEAVEYGQLLIELEAAVP